MFDHDVAKALSELTRAIDESTQQRRDEQCHQEVFDAILARATALEKRLKHVAKAFRKLDAATPPQ